MGFDSGMGDAIVQHGQSEQQFTSIAHDEFALIHSAILGYAVLKHRLILH